MARKKDDTAPQDPPAQPTAEELAAAEEKAAADAAAAAEANTTKKGKKVVELKDKETGFYDSATGFQVVRNQQVELGETIGTRTQEALASGRLLYVK